jgi:protein MpaA
MTMVHGDEITPLYLGIEIAHWPKEHPELLIDTYVVIAPLVNPDGFFEKPRTRGNARGVDVNRNFPTRDWPKRALKAWKVTYRANPRRFPGWKPGSEPETIFQQELIQKIRPQKILSIHSPLNFMDYDGPTSLSLGNFQREYVRECLKLRKQLKAKSSGFFPGSLGNYTGQEMGIPTVTLELPSADANKGEAYWKRFQMGIKTMIEYKMPQNTVGFRDEQTSASSRMP